jgi:hypothetical protein
MPQNPIVPRPGGTSSKLNVTAPTVIKATPGTVYRVVVVAAATGGTFGIYDAATTGGASATTAIFQAAASWPAAGTVLYLEFSCNTGIVVNPGTAGVVAVSFS